MKLVRWHGELTVLGHNQAVKMLLYEYDKTNPRPEGYQYKCYYLTATGEIVSSSWNDSTKSHGQRTS